MVQVAHVGCGYWGRNLVRNYSELDVLAAVVDADPATCAAMTAAYGVPSKSLGEILADPAIDCVSIATPAATHASIALAAIKHGKHVFVEKPLALTGEDCETLIKAADRAQLVLMVGHLLRYHPVFISFARHVHDGLIGDLRYVYSNRLSFGKFRTEENVLWSFAPHDISMVLAVVGREPVRVEAQGTAASYVSHGVADWATVHLAFTGGVRGHVQVSWLHPFKEQRLVAIGSKGMLVFEDTQPEWTRKLIHYPHRLDLSGQAPQPVKGDAVYLEVPKGEPLKAECRHFIDCVARGERPTTDGREGRAVLNVLALAEVGLQRCLAEV